MPVPNRPNDSPVPSDSSNRETPKRGGFGAFSAMYRARWAMSYPNLHRAWPTDGNALPLALPHAVDAEPMPALSAPRRDAPNDDEHT